jgi:hypothetical protein
MLDGEPWPSRRPAEGRMKRRLVSTDAGAAALLLALVV